MGLFVRRMSEARMGASRHNTKIVAICDGGKLCESSVVGGAVESAFACDCLSEYSVFSIKVRFCGLGT